MISEQMEGGERRGSYLIKLGRIQSKVGGEGRGLIVKIAKQLPGYRAVNSSSNGQAEKKFKRQGYVAFVGRTPV